MTEETSNEENIIDLPKDSEPETLTPVMQEQITHLTDENKKLRDDRLRALADVENLRRRFENSRMDGFQHGVLTVIRPLLNVLDDLERTLENAGLSDKENLIAGVEATVRSLKSLLENQGVEAIPAQEGSRFDPLHHEALFQQSVENIPEGDIVQVVRKGYKIGENLIRAVGVAVASSPPPKEDVQKL